MINRVFPLLFVLFAIAAVQAGSPDAVHPFDGKDLAGWKVRPHHQSKPHWVIGLPQISKQDPRQFTVSPGDAILVNEPGHGCDLYTAKNFGDIAVDLEVMIPRGSNSGVYLMGEYEVQVLDSTGHEKNPDVGDMGAIYGVRAPTNPIYKKPGEWNTMHIEFRAPRFDKSGNKIANAKFTKVMLNGRVIHEDIEVTHSTRDAITGKEHATGPLMLQGDHGPVAYRNITITPLK